MYGSITKDRYGNYIIHVDGYPERTFIYYNKREAIKLYREKFNLKYKKINFLEVAKWIIS